MSKVLAIDLGASSGRFIIVEYKNNTFTVEETYRFKNGMEMIDNHLRWNFDSIFNHIKEGLKISLTKHKDVQSIGVDTWAVDYGLLDKNNNLIANPIGYRDERNNKASAELLKKINYKYIYIYSGIQFLPFNSIFQLYDDMAKIDFDKFLLIPDLINFYLTGNKYIELTNLSTTALYDPINKEIATSNKRIIDLDDKLMSPIIYPSKKVGTLKYELCEELDIYPVDVVSVGSHDTASAIASIKLDEKSAYLSSGTWSLLGVELAKPLINEETYLANFTNEIGLEHTVRFLKNIMGLFIIQEIKKDYDVNEPNLSFQTLQNEAIAIDNNQIYIDVEDELFQKPGDMLNKYYAYLKKTSQFKEDLSRGEIIRSIYESMAFNYFKQFELLKKLTKRNLQKIVVIGGGSNSKILNQLIANSLNVVVETGLSEATVFGNALAQLIYLKEFNNLNSARDALSSSTIKEIYHPNDIEKYQNKYQKYLTVIGGSKNG